MPVRLVLSSSTSISVFALTITRPRPDLYASKMLLKKSTRISNIGVGKHPKRKVNSVRQQGQMLPNIPHD